MAIAEQRRPTPVSVRLPAGLVEKWDSLLYLGLILLPLVWAIRDTAWVDSQTPLVPLAVAGLLLGYLLAHWRALPPLIGHWLVVIAGGSMLLRLFGPAFAPNAPGWQGQLEALSLRSYLFVDLIQRGYTPADPLLSATALAGLVFFLGYQAAWTCYRRGWFWGSILPTGIALLGTLGFVYQPHPMPLALYLVGAAALLVRINSRQREQIWQRLGITAPRNLAWRAIMAGTLATIVLVSASWIVPEMGRDQRVLNAWEAITRPWEHIQSTLEHAFNPYASSAIAGNYTTFGPSFEINDAPYLSDEPVARMAGTDPRYLKAVSYDQYTGRGWSTTTPESFTATDGRGTLFSSQVQLGPSVRLPTSPASGTPELAEIEILRSMGALMLIPGQFTAARGPVNVRVGWERYEQTTIDIQGTDLTPLPSVIQPLATMLRDATGLPSGSGTAGSQEGAAPASASAAQRRQLSMIQAEIDRLARQRGIIASFEPTADGRVESFRLSGYVPRYDDVEGVYATRTLGPGSTYRVLAVNSEVEAARLRAVTEPAPDWVRARYLDLPENLPDRVSELAATITQHETTTYDRVKALELALRTLPYDDQVTAPPADLDVVDYFLFDLKRGHCEYFASALAVMARSLDIPARVVTGFNPGEEMGESRLVRERNAHAWVEVYFAGYGWIPFEPTPAVAADARGESPAELPAPIDLTEPDLLTPPQLDEDISALTEPPTTPEATSTGAGLPAWLMSLSRIVQVSLLVVLAVAGTLAALWWRGVRGLRGADRWYGRIQWLGQWVGLRASPSTTPLEFANTVARAAPEAAEPVRSITQLYVQERYAGRAPTAAEETGAEHAWARVRAALLRYPLRLRRGLPFNPGSAPAADTPRTE